MIALWTPPIFERRRRTMAKLPHWINRRDVVQQMLQLGIPMDVTRADLIASAPPPKIRIECIGGISETSAFDLDPGGTGYILSLSLAVLRKPFAIAAFNLELPWMRKPVIWLSDPAEGDGPRNTYQFPGRHPLEFPRDVAINHHANAQRNLPPGKCIEGLLLGYGLDSIPDRIKHGGHAVGRVSITDQFGEDHSAEISFCIDRSARSGAANRVRAPRTPLFKRCILGDG
jgi:hypothetical protein